jgi:hypothetical protein
MCYVCKYEKNQAMKSNTLSHMHNCTLSFNNICIYIYIILENLQCNL